MKITFTHADIDAVVKEYLEGLMSGYVIDGPSVVDSTYNRITSVTYELVPINTNPEAKQ